MAEAQAVATAITSAEAEARKRGAKIALHFLKRALGLARDTQQEEKQ